MWTQYRDLLEATRAIEADWRAADNACEAFPEIVWERTSGLDLSPFGDLANVPELLETAAIASLQLPSTFSDLYFKLYDNGKFWVEVLNWWASDINVHDHNFSGVQFQLTGRSLNVVYRFDWEARTSGLSFGELSVASAEVWNEGSRSFVSPGTVAPHNVSHLDVPTVSLLIRTHPNAAYGGQRNYLAPDVAGDYGVADIIFRKKIGALRLLARGSPIKFHSALRRVLASQTHTENLFTLLKLVDLVFQSEHVALIHEYAALGDTEAVLVRAVAYHRAQNFLTNTVKYAAGLTEDEILAVSALAAAFSQTSLDEIVRDLVARGGSLDMRRLLSTIDTKLSPDMQAQFRAVLSLFDIRHHGALKAA